MNDYNKYKFKKWLDKSLDKIFAFVFYFPRKYYKENANFKKWIDNSGNKSYNKKEINRLSSKVFRDLDLYDHCKILLFTDYDREIPSHRDGSEYLRLLKSDKWIAKNKLEIEKLSFYNYIGKYYPDYLDRFKNYRWKGMDDYETIIIRRKV